MIIIDKIYGKQIIKERVLIDLINSKSLQRLKKISQFAPVGLYHLKSYSRFEHSVGVMILLRKLGASLGEQIAGLLHDASHTAFSHIFDWIIGNAAREDNQDKSHKNFIYKTEIPKILEKYGFDPKKIVNFKEYGLLERDVPDLCADRIDYGLRESSTRIGQKIIDYLVSNLKNYNGEIIFKNLKSAHIFAINFLRCQTGHWGSYEAVSRFNLISLTCREALNKKILKLEDFYKTDDFVVKKLVKSGDKEILKQLKFLQRKTLPKIKNNSGMTIFKKFRYADPKLNFSGKIKRLSEISKEFQKILKKSIFINKKGVRIFSGYEPFL
jgi:hypothetical protein